MWWASPPCKIREDAAKPISKSAIITVEMSECKNISKYTHSSLLLSPSFWWQSILLPSMCSVLCDRRLIFLMISVAFWTISKFKLFNYCWQPTAAAKFKSSQAKCQSLPNERAACAKCNQWSTNCRTRKQHAVTAKWERRLLSLVCWTHFRA